MQPNIVIRHLAGSKTAQTENIPLTDGLQITLGRETGSTVQFDPDRDDMVSRRHAVIRVVEGGRAFVLADNGSTHGTFLNGQRISQDSELAPGDEIGLGHTVRINFDLDPRPADFMMRTRALKVIDLSAKSTIRLPAVAGTTVLPHPRSASRPAIGEAPTVRYARSPSRLPLMLGSVAAVLLLLAAVAWVVKGRLQASAPVLIAGPSAVVDMSTEEIAQAFSKSVVYVEVKWRLIDKETGKPVYHKQLGLGNDKIPLYVRTGPATFVPWLTTEDDDGLNAPIGFEGSGSGFVVSASGFILTNKHVAAGWEVGYDDVPAAGYLVPEGATMRAIITHLNANNVVNFTPDVIRGQSHWIPSEGGMVFEADRAVPIGDGPHDFDGRNEILHVEFPNTRQVRNAQLEDSSELADSALLKIDSTEPLEPIQLATGDQVNLGQKIVVIGYPGISQKVISRTVSRSEAGASHEILEVIPEPTVTDGVIANTGISGQQATQGETIGTMGDAYQLTVLATGHGNSGGPVFATNGKVVGIFTYSASNGDERVTYAVPIKYGRNLMKAQ